MNRRGFLHGLFALFGARFLPKPKALAPPSTAEIFLYNTVPASPGGLAPASPGWWVSYAKAALARGYNVRSGGFFVRSVTPKRIGPELGEVLDDLALEREVDAGWEAM